MSFQQDLMTALKTAMKAKDQTALTALRAVKSAILLAKTETGAAEELTEDQELKILQKQVKQRKDSASIYLDQGREDLAAPELAEADVISQFLPEAMSEEEITKKTHGSIIPVYPLTEGLGLWDIKRAVRNSLDECFVEIQETLPQSLIKKHSLMTLSEALRNLHLPVKIEKAVAARRRLVYDEFFFFELMLAKRKMKAMNETGIPLNEKGRLTQKFVEILPFKLTRGQI